MTPFSFLKSISALVKAFIARVTADGGIVEAARCIVKNTASLAMQPSGYKATKLYSQKPTSGVGDFTVDRNSTATRVNSLGLIESVAANVPRLDYTDGNCPSLLLEPQQTQIYELTDVMSTQTKTVTAAQHTVGFYGTGTLTFTGAFTGSLVGTGLNDRVELIFTPTAGSLVSTVSGSVTKSQLVTGIYLGSYIPNSTTGQITRLADKVTGAGDVNTFNSTEGVLYAEISALANNLTNRFIIINDGTTSNRLTFRYTTTSNKLSMEIHIGGVLKTTLEKTISDITINQKVALKYKEGNYALWVNGQQTETSALQEIWSANTLSRIDFNGFSQPFFGKVKDLRVYNTALTDAELTQLTTL
jgi:hypothetical protein